jgi:molybdenum-dependent DNA-binding transcriptional regulator ModE
VGGRSGGGSQITPRAKELMLSYDKFRGEAEEAIERIFQKHFSSLNDPYKKKRS